MGCLDCHGRHSECRECVLSSHSQLPFHRLERWNGKCFLKSSLFEQEVVLHIGHGGQRCPSRPGGHRDLWEDVEMDEGERGPGVAGYHDIFDDPNDEDKIVIVDSAGVFVHQVAWCTCSEDHAMQLFREALFPNTFKRPKTAFTFNVLDHFHIDAMECKTTAMSFYQKLQRLTDNAFPGMVHVSNTVLKFNPP